MSILAVSLRTEVRAQQKMYTLHAYRRRDTELMTSEAPAAANLSTSEVLVLRGRRLFFQMAQSLQLRRLAELLHVSPGRLQGGWPAEAGLGALPVLPVSSATVRVAGRPEPCPRPPH
jgi:hypothetical protein